MRIRSDHELDDMDTPWPAALTEQVRATCGPPDSVKRLGGMSGARVYRVHGARRSLILKEDASLRETYFYERIAPALHAEGIETPRFVFSLADQERHWLALEDIPYPLPRVRWDADPGVLAVLARLHAIAFARPLDAPPVFVPEWTDAMTDSALAALSPESANEIAPVLRDLQRQSQPLFAPHVWISGDPNPTNWGVRANGTLVLFDWDRFTRAHPAIDLAITVPGFGDWPTFRRVATRYVERRHKLQPRDELPPEHLATDMARAKVWTIIALLSEPSADDNVQRSETVTRLSSAFPGWLQSLIAELHTEAANCQRA